MRDEALRYLGERDSKTRERYFEKELSKEVDARRRASYSRLKRGLAEEKEKKVDAL